MRQNNINEERMKMENKIAELGVCIKPQMDFVLMLLLLDKEKNNGILCNNFIELSYAEDLYKDPWLEFSYLCEFDQYFTLDTYKIPKEIITKDNFVKNLKEYLKNQFLVMFNIDTYYIDIYPNYSKIHAQHEIIVYGYTDSYFLTCDYFGGSKINKARVKFEQLEAAFVNYQIECKNNTFFDYLRGLVISRPNEHMAKEIDIDKIFYSMEGLLKKEDRHVYLRKKSDLEVFDKILKYIDDIKNDEFLDIRIFHVLYIHIKFMVYRIQQLNDLNDNIFEENINKLEENMKLALIIRNLILKYNKYIEKGGKNSKNNLKNKICEMQKNYTLNIKSICSLLKNKYYNLIQ